MKKLSLICLIIVMVPWMANAATLSAVANKAFVDINQRVRVDISLDTHGEVINAIQGTLRFPGDQFSLAQIDTGDSPISFWVDAPMQSASGVIPFSGIIPGGITGFASSVISIWLTPITAGKGIVSLLDLEVLRHDGSGTEIPVQALPATIMVSSVIATSSPSTRASLIAPESFTPVVSRDPNVYDGRFFLAFAAVDKGSGIDHYEVLEVPSRRDAGFSPLWREATSPYLLQDQTLSSEIYVRAVSHDGNFIVVRASSSTLIWAMEATPNGYLGTLTICVALFFVLLSAYMLLRKKEIL